MDPETPASKRPSVQIELSQAPDKLFAATQAFIVDRGTSFVLVYVSETGNKGSPPAAVEVVVSPVTLNHFSRRGAEILNAGPVKVVADDASALGEPPETWLPIMVPVCANAVFNAAAADLVATDFYLIPPRAVFEANQRLKAPDVSAEISVRGEPVVTCVLDVWHFARLIRRAGELSTPRLAALNAAHLAMEKRK